MSNFSKLEQKCTPFINLEDVREAFLKFNVDMVSY